jgi:NAD(P)-dependent dehydrogenase (short-subunit alcohol dehydrogenase family)
VSDMAIVHTAARKAGSNADPAQGFRLDGRVVVVTGASSGIGRRLALTLSGAGAGVVVAARRRDSLHELSEQMAESLVHVCDLSREEDRQSLVAAATAWHGRVDVLVNNAGTTNVVRAEDEPVESFRQVIELNLVAPFSLASKLFGAISRSDDGSVINIASVNGLVGLGRVPQASYAASKGAIIGMTRELAAQWGRSGVRVNAIAPGWFRSELTAEMFDDERSLSWVRKNTPLGRPGEESELDGAALFLASPMSRFVTGQVVVVDGGWTSV